MGELVNEMWAGKKHDMHSFLEDPHQKGEPLQGPHRKPLVGSVARFQSVNLFVVLFCGMKMTDWSVGWCVTCGCEAAGVLGAVAA